MTVKSLEIQNLTVETSERHRVLVDNLSLTISRGSILALVGASGSGKSLTCAACLDVLPAGVVKTRGDVLVDGSLSAPSDLRGRQVATIMQNPRSAFNPVRTMRDHALETLKASGRTVANAEREVEMTLLEVGLEEPSRILQLHAFEMSGGMLQRMMIALALLGNAPFLFADEPTTDLDLIVQMRILELLERLASERGLGILLVTHDMGVVARLADKVAVLDQGRLVESGAVEDIFASPEHPVTRLLVGAHLSLYGMELAR